MKHVLLCAALMCGATFATTAQAAPYIIGSSASAASVNLSLVSGAVAAGAGISATSGTGNTYDQTSLVAVNQSLALGVPNVLTIGETLTSGAVNSHSFASTTKVFHGIPVSTTGTVTVANPKLAIGVKLLGQTLAAPVALTADVITSTSVAGQKTGGGYYATGSSTLSGLKISVAGVLVNLGLDANAQVAANTTINVGLVKIILNEQIYSSGALGASIITNAIHIILSDYVIGGSVLSGDIIVGHSSASVPEPGTWMMMILGFGLIGQAMRKGSARTLLRRRQLA